MAFAQLLFLGEGEEVDVAEAFDPAREAVSFFVGGGWVAPGLAPGGLEGGAPLGLYLVCGFGSGGLRSLQVFGESLCGCAGGGEVAGESGGLAGEVRTLRGGATVGVCGLGSQSAQRVATLADGGREVRGDAR